ncbi:MAG: SDR family oxidoreductase [Chloroflexi bacterium]|nr:SDR family oxidoreductase [Chloroflexota bacterium]
MGDRLKGRAAVVTGAGRGMGRAIALAMAQEGAGVVVNDLGCALDGSGASKSPADEVVAEIRKKGGTAVASYDSVATTEGGASIIKAATDSFGKIDILVNVAGIQRPRLFFEMTAEEWDAVLKVNLYGVFNCTRPAAALMWRQKSGRIINTASIAGIGVWSAAIRVSYSSSKEGIIGFTRAMAIALGGRGITCNAIRPTAATRMTQQPDLEHELRRQIIEAGLEAPAPPGGETPDAGDVAPLVVWLCTDAAAGVNGCDFRVVGGHIGLYSKPTEIKSIDREGCWTLEELDGLMPSLTSSR